MGGRGGHKGGAKRGGDRDGGRRYNHAYLMFDPPFTHRVGEGPQIIYMDVWRAKIRKSGLIITVVVNEGIRSGIEGSRNGERDG